MLRQTADHVPEGLLLTEGKPLPEMPGGGDGPQAGEISEALMDLLDFAPEWEPPGQLIGSRYQLIERLGAGRYGVTYRAGDTELHRLVALKRLRSARESAREGVRQFILRAQALIPLVHRNIIRVLELGKDAQGLFVVTEYLSGGDLRQRIEQDGAMALDESLALIDAVGQGLACAHQRGTVHGDIRPANIMFDASGVPRLVDFGLAAIPENSDLSGSGHGADAGGYVAPEQLHDGRNADPRSDLYALARTLCHMVTGQAALSGDPEGLPPEIRSAVGHALYPDPAGRPATVDEFLEELGAARAPQRADESPDQTPQDLSEPTAAQKIEALRCQVMPLIEAEQYEQAEPILTQAVELDPSCEDLATLLDELPDRTARRDAAAAIDRAKALRDEGQLDQAIAVLTAALEASPAQPKLQTLLDDVTAEVRRQEAASLLAEAESLLADEKFTQAEQAFAAVLEIDPDQPDALAALKELPDRVRTWKVDKLRSQVMPLIEAEQYEQAEPILTQAVELDPSSEDLAALLAEVPERIVRRDTARTLHRAEALREGGKYDQAVAVLTTALQAHPAESTLQTLLDEITAEAKALEVAPLLAEAEGLMADEQYEQADVKLRAVLAIDPDQPEAAAARADLPERIRARDVEGLRRRAKPLVEAEQYEQAEPVLRQAVELDPSCEDLATLLAELPERIARRDTTRVIDRVRALREGGQHDEAIAVLATALQASPSQPKLQTLLDDVTADAKAERTAPLLAEAESLMADGKFEQAEAKLTAVLAIDPDQPEAIAVMAELPQRIRVRDVDELRQQALSLVEAEQYEQAGPLLKKAVELDPSCEDLAALLEDLPSRTARRDVARAVARAEALQDGGRHSQAIAVLAKALQANPGEPTLQTLLDEITAEAKALEVAPLLAKAEKLMADEKFEQAEIKLAAALAIDPNQPEATEALADLSGRIRVRDAKGLRRRITPLIKAEKYEQAEPILRQAVELDPSSDDLAALLEELPDRITRRDTARVIDRVEALRGQGQVDEAIAVLTTALQANPAEPTLQALLADAMAEAKAQEVAPLLAEAQRLLADEEFKQAAVKLTAVLAIDPDHPEATEALAELPGLIRTRDVEELRQQAMPLIEAEQYEQAGLIVQKALELDPSHEDLATLLDELPQRIVRRDVDRAVARAEALREDGQQGEAIADLTKALHAHPAEPELQALLDEITAEGKAQEVALLLAEAERLTGDEAFEQAEVKLNAVLAIDPDHGEAKAALAELAGRIRVEKVEDLRQQTASLIEAEQYEQAEPILREAVELDPSCDDLAALLEDLPDRIARRDVARVIDRVKDLRGQGQYDEAIAILTTALGANPAETELQTLLDEVTAEAKAREVAPLLAEAETLLADEEFEQAQAKLTAVLAIEPDHAKAATALDELPGRIRTRDVKRLHLQATPLIEAQQYEQAGLILQKAIELDPSREGLSMLLEELPDRIVARDVERLRLQAMPLIEAEQYEQAGPILQKAVQLDPSREDLAALLEQLSARITRRDVSVAVIQAEAMREQRKYSRARSALMKALKAHPGEPELQTLLDEITAEGKAEKIAPLMAKAERRIACGKFERARAKLTAVLAIDPDHPEATAALEKLPELIRTRELDQLRTQIMPLIEAEQYEQAEPILTQAVELDPSCEDLAALLAELPERITRRDVDHAIARAEALRKDGQHSQAVAALTTALQANPDESQLKVLLDEITAEANAQEVAPLLAEAERLLAAEEFEQAEVKLTAVLAIDPDHSQAAAALSDLPERIRTRDVEGLRRRAIPLVEAEKYEQAEPILRQAVELDPSCEDLATLLSDLPDRIVQRDVARIVNRTDRLRKKGKYAQATAVLNAAIEANPLASKRLQTLLDDVTAEAKAQEIASLLAEAERLIARDEFEHARAELSDVLAIDPDHSAAAAALAELPERITRRDVARAISRTEALRKKGRYAQATAVLTTAIQDNPSGAEQLQSLLDDVTGEAKAQDIAPLLAEAEKLICGDEFEQAEVKLAAVLAIDPDQPEAQAALAELPERIRARDAEGRHQEALLLIEAEQHEQAGATLEKALTLDPSRADLKTLLAELPERIVQRDTTRDLRRAEALRDDGQYDRAISVLTAALEANPSSSELTDLLDEVTAHTKAQEVAPLLVEVDRLMADGEFGQAEVQLTAVLAIDPDHEAALTALADLPDRVRARELDQLRAKVTPLLEAEQYEQAEPVLREAVELDPSCEDLATLLEELPARILARDVDQLRTQIMPLIEAEQYEKARPILRNAVKLDPSCEDLATLLAELPARIRARELDQLRTQVMPLIEAEQYEHAEPILRKAVKLDPSCEDLAKLLAELPERIVRREVACTIDRAKALRQDGKHDEAIDVLTAAVGANPSFSELQDLLDETAAQARDEEIAGLLAEAERLMADNEFEQAEARLNAAREIDPNRTETTRAQKKLSECVARHEVACALERAEALQQEGQYDKAIAVLTDVLKANPGQPHLRALLDEVATEAAAQRTAPLMAQAERLMADNAFELAEARLAAVLAIEPDHAKALAALDSVPQRSRQRDLRRYHDIAMVLVADEKYDEAGRFLAEAIKIDATRQDLVALREDISHRTMQWWAHPLVAKACEFIRAGKLDAATDRLTKALERGGSVRDLAAKLLDALQDSGVDGIGQAASAASKLLAEKNYPLVHSICNAVGKRHKTMDDLVQLRREADALAREHKRRLAEAGAFREDGKLAEAAQAFTAIRGDFAWDDHAAKQAALCQDLMDGALRQGSGIDRQAPDHDADENAEQQPAEGSRSADRRRRRVWTATVVILLATAALAWGAWRNWGHLLP